MESDVPLVRPMTQSDVPELLRLMKAIVQFERGTDFSLTEDYLLRWGFGSTPTFGAFVAEVSPGRLCGMAVHYLIPFMHTTKPRLMLKWLYTDPEFRGRGVGHSLMGAMARYAEQNGHSGFRWFVLKDNENAQAFYRAVGGRTNPDWDYWHLPGEALSALADL